MQPAPTQGYRLSPGQKRLWALGRGASGHAYRAQCALLIEGNVDVPTLKRALQHVVARYEILRTTFRQLPGEELPVQVIAQDAEVPIQDVDLQGLAAPAQEEQVAALFQAALRMPCDMERGPLLHATLVALAPDRHLLQLSLPALCADTTALANLAREIGRAYAAGGSGPAPADEPLQYADLAEWQNELFETEDIEPGRAYWRKLDFAPLLGVKLPFEHEPAQPEFHPHLRRTALPPELTARIGELARQRMLSPDSVFLACWSIVLGRFGDQPDLLIGTACDGRNYQELNDAIGLLAKVVPLRAHLEAGMPFGELAVQLQEQIQSARKWQECFAWEPGERDGDAGFFPLCFDAVQLPPPFSAGDLTFSIAGHFACIDKFRAKLVCVQQDHSVNVELHYDPAAFHAEDIDRLLASYGALLTSAADAPERLIADLPLLTEAERARVLQEWSATAPPTAPQLIHELLGAVAANMPDAIALRCGTQALTYAALDARANQLAHHLQSLGVGPDTLVALGLPRSIDLIVALLATLKAGGAFLPLDLAAPPARLAAMITASGAPILLTYEALAEELPAGWLPPVCLDADAELIAALPSTAPATATQVEHLAYVIYTSGSTGAPKGVAVAHRGLATLVAAQAEAFPVRAGSRVLQFASPAFDAAIAEILVTLGAGATLVLAESPASLIGTALLALLRAERITTVTLPPALLNLLDPTDLPDLQTLVAAGEACPEAVVARWAVGRRFVNAYGPTEASVCATLGECLPGQAVTIGRPLAGTVAYVLDEAMQPLSAGVAGELYLGGIGLARGYLGRPDLTAERFVPCPWSVVSGQLQPTTDNGQLTTDNRLYKSGDRVRWRSDGTLEFLGRVDRQVKLRGFRIELGEIEAALAQHPNVLECAVVAWEDQSHPRRLVAYIVAAEEPEPTAAELRSFLHTRLPDYMIPATFIPLFALPLTPSGKLDRRALLDVRGLVLAQEAPYVAPQTEAERTIGALWQELLQVEKVGVHDNFFDLGGHSLLLVTVQGKIHELFDRELTIVEMLTYTTVRALAQYVSGAPGGDGAQDEPTSAERIEQVDARSESREQRRQRRQAHRAEQELVGDWA